MYNVCNLLIVRLSFSYKFYLLPESLMLRLYKHERKHEFCWTKADIPAVCKLKNILPLTHEM